MSTIGSSLSKGEDGTALINPAVLGQVAGLPKDLTRSAFDAAVVQERANITNNGTGVWNNGEKVSIFGELGTRIWFVGASAALSHARNVSYQGKTYALAADANVFGATTGAPASGTGANGDMLVDAAAGLIYGPKAGGVWPSGVSLLPSSASTTATPVLQLGGTNATATYTVQTLRYAQVGSLIEFILDIEWSALTAGAGVVTITGLPSGAILSPKMGLQGFGVTPSATPYAVVGSNGAIAILLSGSGAPTTDVGMPGTALGSAAGLQISGRYFVA